MIGDDAEGRGASLLERADRCKNPGHFRLQKNTVAQTTVFDSPKTYQ